MDVQDAREVLLKIVEDHEHVPLNSTEYRELRRRFPDLRSTTEQIPVSDLAAYDGS
jgi:hypothetical protein